jgi:hypothetical protein
VIIKGSVDLSLDPLSSKVATQGRHTALFA